MKITRMSMFAIALFCLCGTLFADAKTEAENLVKTMGLEKEYNTTLNKMVQYYTRKYRVPKNKQGKVEQFLKKYMSWDIVKQDVIKLYSKEFTADELKELAKFYSTPLGKKTIIKLPQIMDKASKQAQKRVKSHSRELMAMMFKR